MSKKKKKEKITYIDDGRSFADLSNVQGMSGMKFSKTGTTSSPKEIWDTYWAAVRFMFKPMLVVMGFLTVIFFLTYIIFMFM